MIESAMIDQLVAVREPYGAISAAEEALFVDAMAECDGWHRARNARYAALWEGEQRPMIPVGLFKQIDLATPVDTEGAWLSSSGSSGTATRVFFDHVSLDRIKRAMIQVFLANRFIDLVPANFLLLSPDPARGDHPGYATTFDKFTACAPVKERVFAVDDRGAFQPELALDTLRRWAPSSSPIFVFGLTVYFEQLALCSSEPIDLSGTVRGLTGGGWKGLLKQLGRDEIVARLSGLMRAPSMDVRDLFGLTEHPVHYISCSHGRFHIPKYARFQILDGNGDACPAGEPGLIRLSSPLFQSLPSHDLLTEDRGAWGDGCACGSPLRHLTFLGRVTTHAGTCAHDAAERA